jgi:UPF0042 nucleotide-binding protein
MSQNKLHVELRSFSYKKNGIPNNESGNGGGYVFDCRGILNPGRIDQYKTQSGLDLPVINYLESQTRMPDFIHLIQQLISITIDDYIARGFDHLEINFGCTGGQHRSVYGAEHTLKFLQEKYGEQIHVTITHLMRDNWVKSLED